jgi:putative ABC transport system ATP-binding protein
MIKVSDLTKDYRTGKMAVHALRGVRFDVASGEFASIVGPSGCGKSTLLYVLGGLLKASGGRAEIDGFDITGACDTELTAFRRDNIGFVFQKFNLINALNVYDNLRIACRIQGRAGNQRDRINGILETVGLGHKTAMKPLELSQGEAQRVAIARALVKEPKILLADEPTGNLDSENSLNVMKVFRSMNVERGQTILMITHNRTLAEMADRIIGMRDGRTIDGSDVIDPREGPVDRTFA